MLSVTLVHPAKAVGQNEMAFGWDTHVVPTNILDGSRWVVPHGKGRFGGLNPQFAVVPPVATLLWLVFFSHLCVCVETHLLNS